MVQQATHSLVPWFFFNLVPYLARPRQIYGEAILTLRVLRLKLSEVLGTTQTAGMSAGSHNPYVSRHASPGKLHHLSNTQTATYWSFKHCEWDWTPVVPQCPLHLMAPPGLARRTRGKTQAEAAITSAKDNAPLLAKATRSSSTTSMHQPQTKEAAKTSKSTAKSTPKSTAKPAMLTSKPAAKLLPKLKQTPSQRSTIPPTSTHPPAATRDLWPVKPSVSTRNSSRTRSKATVVADNNFNEIDNMQPSTQDGPTTDLDVNEVEDQDEPSGLVESDQDDNYILEEEAPLEQEDEGAAEEEEHGMDIDDMANVQLLEQQLAATKERMSNKRKCNVNTPTPATSQATMGDVIQAEHNVLDAHLKKMQKTLKTGLPSIDSIQVIREREWRIYKYFGKKSKKYGLVSSLHQLSTNHGSNISIAPSESGIPSGAGSTTI
ncbi:hypothetical protein M422DRAFT_242017 [Sphaerobolus stellatus SS14]|nr:hypothetical protein M422DRAFT_242017 [Sphaerobolus stellatus SS14]